MGNNLNQRPWILLLEDEALIALDLQDGLQEAGYRVGGPFASCRAALDWLRTAAPSLAILDTLVRDGDCCEVARELDRRGIPFLVYSGQSASAGHREELGRAPWIEKPVGPAVLIEACGALLQTAG